MEGTALAKSLAVYLANAELVASTSQQTSANPRVEQVLQRSYMSGGLQLTPANDVIAATAISEGAPLISDGPRSEDRQLAELQELRLLKAGWDGEGAERPNPKAIHDAKRFVLLAGSLGAGFEPSLHVDGSVVLELPEGGALQFAGDSHIAFAIVGRAHGIVEFGAEIPDALLQALA